ncbi:hypothetical protein AAHA92_23154 [Salvia divinorum]|uniref:Uncharacterized protein n=1 Tax=Salvia divinorum TaxID=28513 RepID=A0ABD1GR39_SALDI
MDTRGGSSATTLMFEAWQQLKHLKRLELLQVLDLSYNEEDTCANQHFWGVYLLLNLVQLVIVGNAVVVSLARG